MKQVRLPTSKLAVLLLGLCFERPGSGLDASPDGRWLSYRWRGPRGGDAMVSVRADDDELVAVLRRILAAPAAFVELAALLVALGAHGGVEGGWAFERAAELLYGTRTAKSHRGRETPRLRRWLELMARAHWRINLGETQPSARKGAKRRHPAPDRLHVDGALVSVEGRTVRLCDALAAGLRSPMFATVPASLFLLTRAGHRNPQGNLPSVAVRARMRVAAAIAARWRDATGQRIRPEELLEQWAGIDLDPVRRRRRVRTWTRTLEAVLDSTGAQGGPALGRDTEWDERQPLRSLLRIVLPKPTSRSGAGPLTGPSG